MAVTKKEAGPIIRLTDKVDVISTDKDPHHQTGDWFRMHPEVAKRAKAKGFITIATEKEVEERNKKMKEQAAKVEAARKKQAEENQ